MFEIPKFMQGVCQFEGHGLDKPASLNPKLTYTVPSDKRVQPLYIRAGNSSAEMVYLVLMSNGKPMRYCPMGAKSGIDVGFHIVETVKGGAVLEVCFAAPAGVNGQVVVDVGLAEN